MINAIVSQGANNGKSEMTAEVKINPHERSHTGAGLKWTPRWKHLPGKDQSIMTSLYVLRTISVRYLMHGFMLDPRVTVVPRLV